MEVSENNEDPYDTRLLKKYSYWGLYMHEAQHPYIGRCYAAALRSDADLVTDMTPSERDELFDRIVPEWKKAVRNFFPFDRENLAMFWNDWPHLHAHLIPRRFEPFFYGGEEFRDTNPKGNYSPFTKKALPAEMLAEIFSHIALWLQDPTVR